MVDKTIIYTTDNSLDDQIANKCKEELKKIAGNIPIISVSHKPVLDLGINIALGEMKRCWMSLYLQLQTGLMMAKTKHVIIAEHDCLYTPEHLEWTPPRDDTFYYNENVWFVQWGGNHPELNGMYSTYWDTRMALSQLITNRELLLNSINERIYFFNNGLKSIQHAGEPGVAKDVQKAAKWAISGRPVHLQKLLENHITKYNAKTFKTKLPNLDIRHSSNFTGPKRGKNRRYELPYWGKFTINKENYEPT